MDIFSLTDAVSAVVIIFSTGTPVSFAIRALTLPRAAGVQSVISPAIIKESVTVGNTFLLPTVIGDKDGGGGGDDGLSREESCLLTTESPPIIVSN